MLGSDVLLRKAQRKLKKPFGEERLLNMLIQYV